MDDKTHYPALVEEAPGSLVPFTPNLSISREANSDEQMIELWLHGRSPHTRRAYRADASRFWSFTGVSLHQARLTDLQSFSDALEATGVAPASRNRTLSSVKSLFAFSHRLGYLPFDTAKPLRLPPLRDRLSERILDESQVQRMLALEMNPRNSAILYLLYAAGIRVSELCGLRWVDVQERGQRGQISVFGKGGKTRVILIPGTVKVKLDQIRQDTEEGSPVFRSRRKRPISAGQVLRVVKAAAKRADICPKVSTHWLRHAHASHSLDRGCPISLVQTTLGHASVATTGRYLHARPNDSSSRFLPL